MIFDLPMFTLIHVVISVLGIFAGLVIVGGLMAGDRMDGWTSFFLAMTILTSVTGFGFPITTIAPPHIVGAVSLVVLAVCVVARYWKQLAGGWRVGLRHQRGHGALSERLRAGRAAVHEDAAARGTRADAAGGAPFAVTQGLMLVLFVCAGIGRRCGGFGRAGATAGRAAGHRSGGGSRLTPEFGVADSDRSGIDAERGRPVNSTIRIASE